MSFRHCTPATRLVLRSNAIDDLCAELGGLGVTRPMLLAGGHIRRSKLFNRCLVALRGLAYFLPAEVVPAHSSVELVEELAAQGDAHGVDGFVSVGGGSASDTAKAVAILMAERGRLSDHAVRFTPPGTLHHPRLDEPKLPIVAIPQTASGAEVTASLGVRDAEGAKLLFTDIQVAARLVLIDPRANLEIPAALMCSTGMNGLAHCVEGLYSKKRSPLAETLALEAIGRFARALPAVRRVPRDETARAQLLYAAHLSGQVLLNARTCLHHAVCHAIGSVTGVAHGDANAVLLPHAVAFNADFARDPLARATHAFSGIGAKSDLPNALAELQKRILVPTRLRDIGVSIDALDSIAAKAMNERGLFYNPRTVTNVREVRALLEAAF